MTTHCAHRRLITIKDGVEIGRCKVCGDVRVYGSDQRSAKFKTAAEKAREKTKSLPGGAI